MPPLPLDAPFFKLFVLVLVVVLFGIAALVQRHGDKSPGRELSESAGCVVEMAHSLATVIFLVVFVVMPYNIQAFYVPSGSMEDTLKGPSPTGNYLSTQGDRLLASTLAYHLEDPHFQDVVVFRPPASAGQPPGTHFVKRCIGTPGDVVEMRGNTLYRGGQPVHETYPKWNAGPNSTLAYDMKIFRGRIVHRDYWGSDTYSPWKIGDDPLPANLQLLIANSRAEAVPAGNYLMLGDHRSDSNDSHMWGFVPRQNILGKAIVVFWPPQRIALVDHLSHGYRP